MSATTLEITKKTWPAFFTDVSRQYGGWGVTIEVLEGEMGDQPRLDGLPLQGISFEPAGSQAGDIIVEAGELGTPFETHLVHKPQVVRQTVTLPSEVDIEIEADEGLVTLIHLRRRPELPLA